MLSVHERFSQYAKKSFQQLDYIEWGLELILWLLYTDLKIQYNTEKTFYTDHWSRPDDSWELEPGNVPM